MTAVEPAAYFHPIKRRARVAPDVSVAKRQARLGVCMDWERNNTIEQQSTERVYTCCDSKFKVLLDYLP